MAGTAVWIDVLPSLSGFGSKLVAGTRQQAKSAGKQAGQAFSAGMSETSIKDALQKQVNELEAAEKRCQAAVNTSKAKIVKAREDENAAALQVLAAEQRLSELRAKSGVSVSSITAAEARLASARGRLEAQTLKSENAEEQLKAAQSGLKATSEQLKTAQGKLAAEESKLSSATDGTSGKTKGFRGVLEKWTSAAKTAAGQAKTLADQNMHLGSVSGWASAKIGAIAGITQAAFSKVSNAITSNISGALNRADQMNNFPIVMQNLGYSADDASKSIKKISASLDGLPTTSSAMTGMVTALAPLTANLDEATTISLALNNAMLAGGASMGEQENAMTQYTQMLAAGTVDMAAWRSMQAAMPGQLNQLGEALLGAGKNGNDLYEAMKNGEVSFDDFNRAIVNLNENGFGQYASFADQAKGATQGVGTAIGNMTNRIQKQIQKIFEAFGVTDIATVINNFSSSFTIVGDKVAGWASSVRGWIDSVYAKFQETGVFQAFQTAWDTLSGAVQNFLGIGQESEGIWSKLTAPESVASAAKSLANAIKWVGDNFNWIMPVVMGVVGGFYAVKGALIVTQGAIVAYNTATTIATSVQKAYTAATAMASGAFSKLAIGQKLAAAGQWLLNAAMNANPLMWVVTAIAAVVAGLTLFFTKTETGRAIWSGFCDWFSSAWQSVCDAFNTAWTWIDQTVIQPFKTAIAAIGNALQWFNDTIVQPVWNAIKTAFQIAFLAISTAVILPFQLAIERWGGIFIWLYETVIQPVWNSISNAFQTAWMFIDTNVVQPFQAGWQALGEFFKLIGDGLMTAWQWVVEKFQSGWQWIDSNVVQPFQAAWETLKAGFQAVGNGLRTAWQWVVDKFQAGWQWIDQNVIQLFRNAWQGVQVFFSGVGTGLKNTWDGVKNAFKSVWDWIDKNVIQPFRKGFDSLGKAVQNMKDAAAKAFEALKDACATPVRWIVEVVYTNGIQKTWNGIAGAVGLDNLKLPDAPKFARGGVSGGINPGYAPGHDTILAMTSPGEAWMVPEWTRAVGADNVYRWNAMARHQGVDAVRQDMGLDGYKTGGVVQHFDGGGISGLWNGLKNGVSNTWNWAKQKASDIADAVKAFVKDPGAWITSKILNPVKSLLGGITGGSWGQIVAQLPIRTVQGLIEKAKAAVSRKKEAGELSTVEYTPSAGVEQWRDLVIECLKEVGQPVSLVNSVLRRMNQESGGNPNAINNWDVNAKNGVPSQGLMQTIPPTFKAYAGKYANRPITDPKANIIASMNYALARYGSLSAAYDRAGGYKTGGIVPTLYDKGGILPVGDTYVTNRTTQPELIMTREQLVKWVTGGESDGQQSTVNMNIRIPQRSDPWSDAAIWINTAKSMIGGR